MPPKSKNLVILTDCSDVAATEIRLSISQYLPENNRIAMAAPIVNIEPWSITNGQFLTRLVADSAASELVLFVVLNPVPELNERVAGVCNKGNITFIGRNTGVFGWLTKDLGISELVEIDQAPYVPFGGKNIYPKAVASLLEGASLQDIGTALRLDRIKQQQLDAGVIVHIDNFGIAKIFETPNYFKKLSIQPGSRLDVFINGSHKIQATYQPHLMAGRDREWVVYDGSSLGGLPELAQVRTHGASSLGLKIGDVIRFEKVAEKTIRNET